VEAELRPGCRGSRPRPPPPPSTRALENLLLGSTVARNRSLRASAAATVAIRPNAINDRFGPEADTVTVLFSDHGSGFEPEFGEA